jgi:hypothetical protein
VEAHYNLGKLLTNENRQHIRSYLDKRSLPYNIQSLEKAYGDLLEAGYIEIDENAVVKAGTKRIDFGAQPRTRTVPADLQREINAMSSSEYNRWLQVPANRARVNA